MIIQKSVINIIAFLCLTHSFGLFSLSEGSEGTKGSEGSEGSDGSDGSEGSEESRGDHPSSLDHGRGNMSTCYHCDSRSHPKCSELPKHNRTCRHTHSGCYIMRVTQEGNKFVDYVRMGCLCPRDLKCFHTILHKELSERTCVKISPSVRTFDDYNKCTLLPNQACTKDVDPMDESEQKGAMGRYLGTFKGIQPKKKVRRDDLPYRIVMCLCFNQKCNSGKLWVNKTTKEDVAWLTAAKYSNSNSLFKSRKDLILYATLWIGLMAKQSILNL